MTGQQAPYLNIEVELPDGKVVTLSLPNKDVSVDEIVRGLIKQGYLAKHHRYKMSHLLMREEKIYEIAHEDGHIFVIFEDRKGGPSMSIDNKKVFIVHGHETGLRDTVALFLQNLGAKPVILAEEASHGLTVIEKLERYADVGFAVILMTGDDRGGTKDATPKNMRLRARQNVIFELGYFLSKLGRGKVCVLYAQGVEIPSDYAGVIYVAHDAADGWKIRIARELQAAGLNIDANRLIMPG